MYDNNNIPKQGDLIWIDAEPHAGIEYGGHDPSSNNNRRPMLVVSDIIYNTNTGMIVGFPITSSKTPENFPSSVLIKIDDQSIHGHAVLSRLLGYDYVEGNGQIVGAVNRIAKQKALDAVKNIFGFLVD